MKKLLSAVCIAAMGALFCGCATTSNQATGAARFHENAATDVIIRFNRWDTMQLLRPDSREGGYLPLLNRDGVLAELRKRQLNRSLAAVVVPFGNSPDGDAQNAREWTRILSQEGFRRVVMLRAGYGNSIDGLLVLHDSAISAADEKSATPAAALAPAAGANVADSSGR